MKPQMGVLINTGSGKAGSTVFAYTKEGTIVKPRIKPRNPNTPAQQAVRAAFTKASKDFKGLTADQVDAWDFAAETITVHVEATGKAFTRTGMNFFLQLASKFYLMNPTGTAPTTPPTADFKGDAVTLTAAAGTGTITFTASGANAADVTTEFLIQRLPSPNRKPQKGGYRSAGYHAFVAGTLTFDVTARPGYYAVAYRFVNTATGQQTAPISLGEIAQVTFAVKQGKKAA